MGSDAYSRITSGVSSGSGSPFSYDGKTHHETDIHRQQYDAWQAVLDTSCIDSHGATEVWRCRDRHHVLLNHTGTPFFLRQDFRDPNREHLNGGRGHEARFSDDANYPHCPPAEPCNAILNEGEYRARLEAQIQTFLRFSTTRSEIGTGADRTFNTPGTLPTSYVWMPACARHDGAYNDDSFFNATISTRVSSYTMRQWLEEFMNAPPLGGRLWQIDGAEDANRNPARTTQCVAASTIR